MNEKNRKIIEEYNEKKSIYQELEKIVFEKLKNIGKASSIRIYRIEHRVKEEQSLIGKLERKGDKYESLSDITDILGLRVVCFFADDVDVLAKKIEENFEIDWNQSIDKRKYLATNSFGYLSVHYIGSLKKDSDYKPEFEKIKFEIQTCSLLQHVWAVMEHDLGYKTKFGIPRATARDFSRLAGLLEIADEHFSRIRDSVREYTNQVHLKIVNDQANDILIDSVSLDEYMTCSHKMQKFLHELSDTCKAEIFPSSAENYIEYLVWLRKEKIGDLNIMLEENGELALKIAKNVLCPANLDIVSSTVALRFLCLAELINREYSKTHIVDFFALSTGSRDKAEKEMQDLFRVAK